MTELQAKLAGMLGLGNDVEGEVDWQPDVDYTQCRMVEDWIIKNNLKEFYLTALTRNCITNEQIKAAILAYPDYSDVELTGRLAGEAIMRSTAKERCEAAIEGYKISKIHELFPLSERKPAEIGPNTKMN